MVEAIIELGKENPFILRVKDVSIYHFSKTVDILSEIHGERTVNQEELDKLLELMGKVENYYLTLPKKEVE